MDAYLKRLREAITAATLGMTAEDLLRHPEGKWSTAEVLEHLYLTYTGTVKGFERCLQSGKPLASPVTFAQRLKIALVIHLGYFPKGRKSPERATPKGTPTDKVMAEIGSQISTMGESIAKCSIAVIPVLAVMIAALMLITFVPELVLFVPRYFGY